MKLTKKFSVSYFLFVISLILIIYMPLHVFISQSASLVTGGLEVWKAAKDVLVFLLLPILLFVAYRQELFKDKTVRALTLLGAGYGLLHGLYLVLDQGDDTFSALAGSVFNARLLLYLLIGLVVGASVRAARYRKYVLTAVVLVASIVALFGVAQYFLPKDLLTNVGYSLERGVKPMFFIDDKPDLPRVMSTLKDPNSLGAYLILPTLFVVLALIRKRANETLFVRPFRREVLAGILVLLLLAQAFTFSRGAFIALVLSTVTLLSIVLGERVIRFAKKYFGLILVFVVLVSGFAFLAKDSYFVQNVIFHADESTVLEDPNELRLSLGATAVERVVERPLGHGPGSAGLVAISNPQGGLLTENYYLQIAYEVGWIGMVIFIAILVLIARQLYKVAKTDYLAAVVLASLVGYAFYSLLIHLWSNETVALQWWLLAGIAISGTFRPTKKVT